MSCGFTIRFWVKSATLMLSKHHGQQTNMPKYVAFILSKSGVNPCSHGLDPLATNYADGQTDGFLALYNRKIKHEDL